MKKNTSFSIQQAFAAGVGVTVGLWWIVALEIVFSLFTALNPTGSASILYTLLLFVIAYISLGLATGKMLFIKLYRERKKITSAYVQNVIREQANRLIAPVALLTIAVLIVIVFLGFLLSAFTSTDIIQNLPPHSLLLLGNLLQIVFTPLVVVFPAYFTLKNLSFNQSFSQSFRFTITHSRFSFALIAATLIRIILTTVIQTYLPSVSPVLNGVIYALWSVYLSTVVYEFWINKQK